MIVRVWDLVAVEWKVSCRLDIEHVHVSRDGCLGVLNEVYDCVVSQKAASLKPLDISF